MRPGDPCVLQFFKYPTTLHWRHDAVLLGEDDFGVWLGARAGSVVQLGVEPARTVRNPQVHLVPRNDWWVFTYNPRHPKATHWADVSSPATFESSRVTAVDLDLDVFRTPSGEVSVDDEDEFALHQVELAYPAELIENARAATDALVEAFHGPAEPFHDVARSWLELVEDEISRNVH